MLDAIRAEARKLWGHRRATWSLLGFLPALLLVVFVCVQVYRLLHGAPSVTGDAAELSPRAFAGSTFTAWQLAQNMMWLFAGAFSAIAFGGEYRWNTLKLITPHRGRIEIIAAKFIVVIKAVALSLALFGVLSVVLTVLGAMLAGHGVPAGVDWGDLLWRQLRVWAQATLAASLVAAYAALASTAMRSTAGGIVVAVIAFIVFALPGQLWAVVNAIAVYRLTPGYALTNLQSWAESGAAQVLPVPGAPIADGWLMSLGIAGAWLAAMIALTTLIFRRQDFN